jgi:ClpP class serine protease
MLTGALSSTVSMEMSSSLNLLAKADLSFEDVHAGAYKSAPEIFTRDSMSAPYREQVEALLDDRYDALLEAIAGGRSLSAAAARAAVEGGPYLVPEDALAAGLVDTICYEQEFMNSVGITEADSSKLVEMDEYLASESCTGPPTARSPSSTWPTSCPDGRAASSGPDRRLGDGRRSDRGRPRTRRCGVVVRFRARRIGRRFR